MSIQVLKKKESGTKQEEEGEHLQREAKLCRNLIYDSLPRTLPHGWWARLPVRESGEARVSTWHIDALNQFRFLVEKRKGSKYWASNQQHLPS